MTDPGSTTTFTVDRPPTEAFDATTDVRGWWSEDIDGPTDQPGAEFTYRSEDLHRARIRVTDAGPGRRVSWLVVDDHFACTEDEAEWTGTTITFDLAPVGGRTAVRSTHQGLTPAHECFEVCSTAWGLFVDSSLRSLITTGEGRPGRRAHQSLDTGAEPRTGEETPRLGTARSSRRGSGRQRASSCWWRRRS